MHEPCNSPANADSFQLLAVGVGSMITLQATTPVTSVYLNDTPNPLLICTLPFLVKDWPQCGHAASPACQVGSHFPALSQEAMACRHHTVTSRSTDMQHAVSQTAGGCLRAWCTHKDRNAAATHSRASSGGGVKAASNRPVHGWST
jgi:hypothetical protein